MRYCIGDIHGCSKTLQKITKQICKADKQAEFYFVGDLIDRGPNSKAVIDHIIELRDDGIHVNVVRGNHEEMMLFSYKNNLKIYDTIWASNGAEMTVKSFSAQANLDLTVKSLIPKKYYEFINSLPYYIETDDYFIVHAGFNFNSDNPFKDFESMVWTREEKNNIKFIKGKKIIHGHTPIPTEQIKSRIIDINTGIINIDSGCIFKNLPGLGFLTALNMNTIEAIFVKNVDAYN